MENLKKLSESRGISGFEYRITDVIKPMFLPYADSVYVDNLGNLIAVKKSDNENAKKVMIEAHMDEIGLMVKSISEDGFITFVNIGGVDERILPSMEVSVHGKKDIKGIIGAKPPHLMSGDDSENAYKLKDLAIDTGFSRDEVSALVSVGDSITLNSGFVSLFNNIYSGKSLDDRAGVFAILEVFKAFKDAKLDVDLYGVMAVTEEVGGRGAMVSGNSINPDIAVAIDVTHGITPDNSKNAFELSSGVAISVGPNIHPKLSKKLISLAKENDIKHLIEVEGGDTGTDAWLLQVAGDGIPTALLSFPLRYMHTTVETISKDDIDSLVNLLKVFIKNLDESMEDWLCY